MNITDVRVRRVNGGKVKAYASVTFDDEFVVHNIKVLDGRNGLYVAMPSRKVGDEFKDVAHPITQQFREKLQSAVIDAYNNVG